MSESGTWAPPNLTLKKNEDLCVIIDHKALDARFTLLPHGSYETYHSLTYFLLPTEYLTHRPPILALAGIQDLLPYHRT